MATKPGKRMGPAQDPQTGVPARAAKVVGGWIFFDCDGDIHLLGCDDRCQVWDKVILVPEDDLGYRSNCPNESCPLGQEHPNFLEPVWINPSEEMEASEDFKWLWEHDLEWKFIGTIPSGSEVPSGIDVSRMDAALHPLYCRFTQKTFQSWSDSRDGCLTENIWISPENARYVGKFRMYSGLNCSEPPLALPLSTKPARHH